MFTVIHIYISPGHNFFGRYGSAPGTSEVTEVSEAECVAGKGIRGDRFFEHRENYKGQITFFAQEVFDELCAALGISGKGPEVLRRNVVTRGIDLNSLSGTEFAVQGIRFEAVEECRPCEWMDHAVGPGAWDFLKGRGGLRCRILTSGILRRDG